MIPVIHIEHQFLWILGAAGLSLLLSRLMKRQEKKFITHDGSLRDFGIMDLEFPSNGKDIPNIIRGIYRLNSEDKTKEVIAALRSNLLLDYLFMPATYGAIFLLCMSVAYYLQEFPVEQGFFALLAWLQFLAWAFDFLENAMLLSFLRKDIEKEIPKAKHLFFVSIVWAKWGIAIIGGICALMMMVYFWVTGRVDV